MSAVSTCVWVHTCNIPSLWLYFARQVDIISFKVEDRIMQQPRLEDQIARLLVKREPRYVNGTLSHREIEPRIPQTYAVIKNRYIVRLRRYFVFVCHLCSVIDIRHITMNITRWHGRMPECFRNDRASQLKGEKFDPFLPKPLNRWSSKFSWW